MNKIRIKSAGRRSTSSNNCRLEQPLEPYRRLPFSPLPVHRPPLHPPSSKMQARKVASRQVENHFGLQHNQYKSRENHHSSNFKVRAKKQKVVPLSSNEAFWMDKLEPRARNIRELNEHYLMDVREELQRRRNWS